MGFAALHPPYGATTSGLTSSGLQPLSARLEAFDQLCDPEVDVRRADFIEHIDTLRASKLEGRVARVAGLRGLLRA